MKIGLAGGGFGPGTGPDTYARALREVLAGTAVPLEGDGAGLDLVHVVDAKRADPRLLSRLRPPLVLDFHDDYWVRPPDYPAPDRFLRRLRQRQLRRHHLRVLARAAVVIVHSRAVARSLEAELSALALPRPPRVCLVPLPVSPVEGERVPPESIAPLILLVGRDLFRKGFPVLLGALPRVREKFPGVRAAVAGREFAHTLLAARLMARGQVEFLGYQSPAALAGLYRRSAVVVLPSYQEAFGISLLEAMVAETPVVASRVGGIPEAVEDGVSGLLHRPGDPADLAEKITRVLSDPGLRSALVAGGRERARRFSPSAMAAALEPAYQQALEAGK